MCEFHRIEMVTVATNDHDSFERTRVDAADKVNAHGNIDHLLLTVCGAVPLEKLQAGNVSIRPLHGLET
jgi:hypothetical protein